MEFAELPANTPDPAASASSVAKVSIVINNFNYGRFLRRAIDSALAQEDENFEVIVVDDGSTDNSLSIARERSDTKLRVVEKPNGGQASAINVGFSMSSGDWIMFLDADDWYVPGALRVLRGEFREGVAKAHFPLIRFHQGTGEDGGVFPKNLSKGDVIQQIADTGNYVWPPTSGNVFRRDALIKVMPIPEPEFKICADTYLCLMVSAYGAIASVDRPLGYYCVHGENAYAKARLSLRTEIPGVSSARSFANRSVAERVLLREKGIRPKRTELDRRENIEIVAIAARFGAIHLEEFDLSREKIFRHWAVSYHDTPKTIRSRFPAFVIWKIINHAPFAIVKVAMQWLASIRSRRFDRMYEQD